jgi:hypothetical protein
MRIPLLHIMHLTICSNISQSVLPCNINEPFFISRPPTTPFTSSGASKGKTKAKKKGNWKKKTHSEKKKAEAQKKTEIKKTTYSESEYWSSDAQYWSDPDGLRKHKLSCPTLRGSLTQLISFSPSRNEMRNPFFFFSYF